MCHTKKKMAGDVLLNLIATTIPILFLQFVVYPGVAKQVPAQDYGFMVTMYAAFMMISAVLGNGLNNVRLLRDGMYREKGYQGDFNRLLVIFGGVNLVCLAALFLYYQKGGVFPELLLVLSIAVGVFLNAYLEVAFRLVLNYKNILLCRTCLMVGYLAGLGLFYLTKEWTFIFLLGHVFSFAFLLWKSQLLKEPMTKTPIFRATGKDVLWLVIATVLGSAMNYADKLVLYPLLGGASVSIYYTAAIFGKVVSMAVAPINNVMLSYLVGVKNLSGKTFRTVLLLGVLTCIVGYFLCLALSRPLLGMLFPRWLEAVMRYIPVTTLAVALAALCSIINPFSLKFCGIGWQIFIHGMSTVVYFAAALVLLHFFGLMGFCVGTAVGFGVKLCIMLGIFYHENNKKERKSCNSEI